MVNPITGKWYKTFCGMLSRAEEEEANRIISNQLVGGDKMLRWCLIKVASNEAEDCYNKRTEYLSAFNLLAKLCNFDLLCKHGPLSG